MINTYNTVRILVIYYWTPWLYIYSEKKDRYKLVFTKYLKVYGLVRYNLLKNLGWFVVMI
jgi:hypothetical protein